MTCLPRLLRPAPLLVLLFVFALSGLPAHAVPAPADAASAAAVAPDDGATLVVFNRPITQLRVSLLGLPPAERVRRARVQLQRSIDKGGPQSVTLAPLEQGQAVLVNGSLTFVLLHQDLDEDSDAKQVAQALQQALDEAREARTPSLLLRALAFTALASLLFGIGAWGLLRLRRWLEARLRVLGEQHVERITARFAVTGAPLLARDRLYVLVRVLTRALLWLLLLVGAAEWLGFVMRQFPFTRRWGEQLHESGIALAEQIAGAVASSLPGLALAVVIFLIARGLLAVTAPLFAQVERGELTLKWVDRDTVRSTRGLVHLGVWLFALAMAYPYLPGAQTDAFKGISVMLGVMVSLGASNILGQAVSGLIITYSHTMRIGEYVSVGDVEGTITAMDTFAARVRTGRGVEMTLPNSLIVSSVTKNYSRTVAGPGFVVDTVLTIGYDTPWRQVHAMMIEAARRTESVVLTPPPRVFQTALSDFYVEYCLVAHATATRPLPRAEVMNLLHANLQDVFNENGVQIMSPHYLGDPTQAKVVPPAQWNPPTVGAG